MKKSFEEERARADLVISNLEDDDKDAEAIQSLCTQIKATSRPVQVNRLGKKQTGKKRPLKASFANPFDARTFKARFEEAKKNNELGQQRLKMRPYRSKEEQAKTSVVRKLNEEVRESGEECSFSLRDNGEIWRFIKVENRWQRDNDWHASKNLV